jgi:hypothetical protein
VRGPEFVDHLLGGNAFAARNLFAAKRESRVKAGPVIGIQAVLLIKELKVDLRPLGQVNGILHDDVPALDPPVKQL